MIVKAYYPGGLVDVFDTDHFTEALPLRGNLLTNYVLDWSGALSGGGIWMRAYWHETADEYRGVVDDAGLPVARRRDGWSFLMADAGDVAMLERLTLDGEIVLERIAGALVDAAALMRAYDAADDLGPRAVSAHRYLEALQGDGCAGDPEDEICRRMGMTFETWREIEAAQTAIAASSVHGGEDFDD
ncbi:Uncharacterised protein [Slackia heliotrinireducens]|uniref:Uncharacterized protein n=1 Tax=Slackia heliotrinireducens (strain ATCC 29202 / DSM 20476 / NCTC 11029 / RHS 1) TaxID=471855 RepID=C7N7N3_SLAHD|nr:hypothetical protein [Slackia heliotrinireducens]ACV22918.1 hypothetical protein Shel_19020 [Slackia heliotrinireducens DSM 20476]VEH01730.1 Uncharacterised protein [Slackia heliotrinireducens]